MPNIIDLHDLETETASTNSELTEIADARRAIMMAAHITDIVLGPSDGSRVLNCRFDEKARAIYPAFDIPGDS